MKKLLILQRTSDCRRAPFGCTAFELIWWGLNMPQLIVIFFITHSFFVLSQRHFGPCKRASIFWQTEYDQVLIRPAPACNTALSTREPSANCPRLIICSFHLWTLSMMFWSLLVQIKPSQTSSWPCATRRTTWRSSRLTSECDHYAGNVVFLQRVIHLPIKCAWSVSGTRYVNKQNQVIKIQ